MGFFAFFEDLLETIVVVAFLIQLVTLFSMIFGSIRIRRWQKEWLEPHGHRPSCKKEGLFLIFLLLSMALFISDLVMLVEYLLDHPTTLGANSIHFKCFIVYQSMSFVNTAFILWFLVAMSHMNWSTLPEEESNRSITFMDR